VSGTATTIAATRAHRRAGQAGFSFIELLVTTIILGLLAAIVIPAVLGQRERAESSTAKALLRTGAGALEASFADDESYAGADAAAMRKIEPNVAWRDTAGALAKGDEVSLSGVTATTYTLTTTTPSGQVFTYVKDLGAKPTVVRTCGVGCTW
jgi:type IV pilus assembly protein PilA